MCKYIIKIETEYGIMNVKADNYQDGMDKYRNIKEEYKNINCCIKFFKEGDDMPQFVKTSNDKSFEKLYGNLRKSIEDLLEYSIESFKEEERCEKEYVKQYHLIEATDIEDMDSKEYHRLLMDLKVSLNKRRLSKLENLKNFAIYHYLNNIIDALNNYEKNKERLEHAPSTRYGNPYYKEKMKTKEDRLKKFKYNI